MPRPILTSLACTLAILSTLTGCDKVVDGSQAAADVTHKTFNDAASAWTDVFTYHPKAPAQGAQTRYCYQMQSDVVCYDSVQAGSTSKLIGYQDGDKISWVQPGGGSLGASGGEAKVADMDHAAPYSPAFINTVTIDPSTQTPSSISAKNLPPASH